MRVNKINGFTKRVNISIDPKANTHRKYLFNEISDLMSKGKFGGEFARDYIKLNDMPAKFIRVLKKANIIFERIKPKKV